MLWFAWIGPSSDTFRKPIRADIATESTLMPNEVNLAFLHRLLGSFEQSS